MIEATQRKPLWLAAGTHGWLFAALALAILTRFWDLTGQSLFIDEGFVFHVAALEPNQILTTVAHGDFHPPLFYLITHYLMNILHWPLWNYRYLTAAFSLTGIAATWAIARRCFGDTAAAIAALALAAFPALVVWDRLYRMYAVVVALTAVSWWLLLVCSDPATKRRWLWWGIYAIAAIALPYVHYVGAIVVASQFVYAISRKPVLWPAVVFQIAAGLALIPWAWGLRIQYHQAQFALRLDSAQFSGSDVIPAVAAYGVPENWLTLPHFDFLVSLIVLAILLAGAYVGRRTLLLFWLAPIIVHILVSIVTGINLVLPRYLYIYVPAYCIGIGALASLWLRSKYRVAAVAFLAAIIGVAAVSVYDVVFVPYYQFPDWYQVNALLLGKESKDDIIVLVQGGEYWIVHDFSAFRHHAIAAPLLPSQVDVTLHWLRGNAQRRIWYIENQPGFVDGQRRIEHDLEGARPRLAAYQQQRIFEEDVVRIMLFGTVLAKGTSPKIR